MPEKQRAKHVWALVVGALGMRREDVSYTLDLPEEDGMRVVNFFYSLLVE